MENRYFFRGKRENSGEWIEGFLYVTKPTIRHYILPYDNYADTTLLSSCRVDSATVGQCTGLKYQNGELIFEDDIIKAPDLLGIIRFGHYRTNWDETDYMCGQYGFYIDWQNDLVFREDLMFWLDKIEKIGNIHDNPELLEVHDG